MSPKQEKREPINAPMSYRVLKRKLALFTEEELDQEVIVLFEGGSYKLEHIIMLEEDHINPSGDGMEPVSFYKDYPEVLAEEPIVAHAGDVFITKFDPIYEDPRSGL